MKHNVLILTDSDLDGCGCVLVLKWLYGNGVQYAALQRRAPQDVISKFNIDNFDKVYICDSYIPDDAVHLIDKPNVYIVDHHKQHWDERSKYKVAKLLMKETYTSCTKLLYDLFKTKATFTSNQKLLIQLIDDYDNYELRYPQSRHLNSIYREYHGTNDVKLHKFVEEFADGFVGFNNLQKNIIKLRESKFVDMVQNSTFYTGVVDGIKVVSTLGGYFNNDLALYAMTKYDCDVSIIAMPDINAVSFRKKKGTPHNVLELAKKYCNGTGHEYAAGGELTEKFLELTKSFTIIK